MFASSLESMLSGKASSQVLESLEECELLVLPFTELQKLYDSVPKMNVLVRKVLESRMINAQKVVASFVLNRPEDRYREFLEKQPELLNRVPHHLLSSYLGMTPVSFSRIRKRIADKDRS